MMICHFGSRQLLILLSAMAISGWSSLATAGVVWTIDASATGAWCDPTFLPVGHTLILDITVRSDDQALVIQGSVNGYDNTILEFDPATSILPDTVFNEACDPQLGCVGGLMNEIGFSLPFEEHDAGPGVEVDIVSATSLTPASGFGDADLGAYTDTEGDPQFRIAFKVIGAGSTTIDVGTFPAYLDAYTGTLDSLVSNASIAVDAGHFAYSDNDADLRPGECDNCVAIKNGRNEMSNQIDSDSDGYGNACDSDYNNDLATTTLDFPIFLDAFTGGPTTVTDHNGDGATTTLDFSLFLADFQGLNPPGPSGLVCAGTIPCTP